MKIFVVSDLATNRGGSYRVAIDTCLALTESGVETHLVHAGPAVDARLHGIGGLAVHQIETPDVATTGGVRGAVNYLWSAKSYRQCGRLFRDAVGPRDGAVVHVHAFSRRLSPAVFAAARRARLPIVLSLHDYFAFSPNGLHYDFAADRVISGKSSRGRWLSRADRHVSHQVLRVLRLMLIRRLGLIPDAIERFVAVSHASARFARRHLPPDKVTTVYSPVPRNDQRAQPWRHKRIVFVGRLTREKGVPQLAQATRRLGLPVRFVGDGPDAAEIQRCNPAAEITGWLDKSGVTRELLEARALALPSRWHETFGLCVAEARSMGLPVVVSRLAGSAEWVTHGRDGFVVDPYHPAALESALQRLADDDTVRRLGEAAREQFARRDTSRAHYARQIVSVYEAVLAARYPLITRAAVA